MQSRNLTEETIPNRPKFCYDYVVEDGASVRR